MVLSTRSRWLFLFISLIFGGELQGLVGAGTDSSPHWQPERVGIVEPSEKNTLPSPNLSPNLSPKHSRRHLQAVATQLVFPANEWAALQSLYRGTGGPNWRWFDAGARWNFSQPLSVTNNPCVQGWEGITCNCNHTKIIPQFSQFYPYGYYYYDDQVIIPDTSADCTVVKLYLSSHNLRGSLPNDLGKLKNLTHIHLRGNELVGLFPSGMLSLSQLSELVVSHNRISGSLPANLANLKSLERLTLSVNRFTGTLPAAWGSLNNLKFLYVHANSLHGSLPPEWSGMTRLQYLQLYENSLVGVLPPQWRTLEQLTEILIDSNSLTSSLPPEWSSLVNLNQLLLYDNSLSKSLPPEWSTMTNMARLLLSNNRLTGSLPASWSAMSALERLVLYQNSLSHTLPSSWSTFPRVSQLLLHSNAFVGSVPSELGLLTNLAVLYLEDNYLTGVIPSSLFKIPTLANVSFAVNCLAIESFTESDFCAARNLEVLVLDGIHSASRCGNNPLFPQNSALGLGGTNAYALPQASQTSSPGIPLSLCLLSLPRMAILHASGAGLVGNLGSLKLAALPINLTDLILSHNYLSGTIPTAIQERSTWSLLDLSSNLLGGTLSPNIVFQPNISLDLSNNRLSGHIPSIILTLANVSILTGNGFSCSMFSGAGNSLPLNDPNRAQYNCGSNEFLLSLLILACVLVSFATLIAVVAFVSGQLKNFGPALLVSLIRSTIASTNSALHSPHPVTCTLERVLYQMYWSAVKMAAIVASLMFVYGLFKITGHTSVPSQEAYTVSVTQMEGYAPAVASAVLQLVAALGIYLIFRKAVMSSLHRTNRPLNLRASIGSMASSIRNSFLTTVNMNMNMTVNVNRAIRYIFIIIANIVVVGIINVLYVAAYFTFSTNVIQVISFALSLFKLVWTSAGVPYLLSFKIPEVVVPPLMVGRLPGAVSSSQQGIDGLPAPAVSSDGDDIDDSEIESRTPLLYTILVVINTVVIPALTIIFVNSQCARYIFQPPGKISASVPFCQRYNGIQNDAGVFIPTTCSVQLSITSSYTPPFLYSYQCSYAILASYASVYTYSFALTGFVNPIVIALLTVLAHRASTDSWLFCILADILPPQCLAVEHVDLTGQSKTLTKWNASRQQKNFNNPDLPVSPPVDYRSDSDLSVETPTLSHTDDVVLRESSASSVASDLSFLSSAPPSIVDAPAPAPLPQYPSIFFFSEEVVQLNQIICVCLSFGIVFPPLCVLGAITLIAHSVFIQLTVRRFALALDRHHLETIRGVPLKDYRKTLTNDCNLFASGIWQCLAIPYVASFPILSFFLWEIVGVSYPYEVGYTIILPIFFSLLGFGGLVLFNLQSSLQTVGCGDRCLTNRPARPIASQRDHDDL